MQQNNAMPPAQYKPPSRLTNLILLNPNHLTKCPYMLLVDRQPLFIPYISRQSVKQSRPLIASLHPRMFFPPRREQGQSSDILSCTLQRNLNRFGFLNRNILILYLYMLFSSIAPIPGYIVDSEVWGASDRMLLHTLFCTIFIG